MPKIRLKMPKIKLFSPKIFLAKPSSHFWRISGGHFMRSKNFKGSKCVKMKLQKSEEVVRTFDNIQTAYAQILEKDEIYISKYMPELNRRISAGKSDEFANASVSIFFSCDSDDARAIIEKTLITMFSNKIYNPNTIT